MGGNLRRLAAFAALAFLASVSTRAHASETWAKEEDERSGRVLAGAGLGLVGGAVGAALGFVAASELALARDDDDCIDACGVGTLGWAVLGGGLVGTAGMALGAYAGAEWVGGDGSLGWTALGAFSGFVLGAGGALAVGSGAPGELIGLTLVLSPLVGAVLGYELSSASGSDPSEGSASLGLSPAPGGASFAFRRTF